MGCYIEYMLTASGLLKLFQAATGIGIIYMLSEGHFDYIDYKFGGLRIDAMALFLCSIVFVFNSLMILLCVSIGAFELPGSTVYRMNFLLGTLLYVPISIAYLCLETKFGLYVQGSIAGALGILNSLLYLANAVIAYHPRIV